MNWVVGLYEWVGKNKTSMNRRGNAVL